MRAKSHTRYWNGGTAAALLAGQVIMLLVCKTKKWNRKSANVNACIKTSKSADMQKLLGGRRGTDECSFKMLRNTYWYLHSFIIILVLVFVYFLKPNPTCSFSRKPATYWLLLFFQGATCQHWHGMNALQLILYSCLVMWQFLYK